VTVTGASGPVTVTGLRQRGTLTLENDAGGVDLDGGQLNGSAYVSGNTAAAPAAITVSGVAVTGSLYCTGNSPAPADAGTLNTVSAPTAADQCTGLEEQG
jgi:5'-nucleotidase